jgi:hypothetical protein
VRKFTRLASAVAVVVAVLVAISTSVASASSNLIPFHATLTEGFSYGPCLPPVTVSQSPRHRAS